MKKDEFTFCCFYANFMPNDFECKKMRGKPLVQWRWLRDTDILSNSRVDAEEYAKKYFDKVVKRH